MVHSVGIEDDGVRRILEVLMNERGEEAKESTCFSCGALLTPQTRGDHLGPDGPHGKIAPK